MLTINFKKDRAKIDKKNKLWYFLVNVHGVCKKNDSKLKF